MSSDLFAAFAQNLAAMSVAANERVLIAVSGGPDSMVLLHLFLRWNAGQIGVFHLNHGFRATASRDAQFVLDYANKHGIPCEIAEYDILTFLAVSGESKQQGARKIRYELLQDYAKKYDYQRIALGHHGDDQAETVLMRLLRGAGLHGLAGIPPQRGPYIRPLLTMYKAEILSYCQNNRIPYIDDESNRQAVYQRNRIRQELLPLLKERYNPEISAQLVQVATLAREDERELQRRADQICQEYSKGQFGQLLFPRKVFKELSISLQRRVLRSLLQSYQGHLLRIDFAHIEEWRKQLAENTTFRLSLPQIWVSANVEYLFVGDFVGKRWVVGAELPVPGQIICGTDVITAEILPREDLVARPVHSEDFDLDSLVFPLYVRTRQAGDRMKPFRGAGVKKVKDLFIDAHIPVDRRDFWPLVCDQEGILWIPAVRRSARGEVHAGTGKILRLSFNSN